MTPRDGRAATLDSAAPPALRVLAWGTYDLGKPRVRILLASGEANGVAMTRCHQDVWRAVEDKSQMGVADVARAAGRWLAAYPRLLARYLATERHDVVFVGYLGHLDVLVIWPFARLRGEPVVWDAFISLYHTVVDDRQLVGPRHPAALLLFAWEWLACRAVDRVVVDTDAHCDYFTRTYRLPATKAARVFVGAEVDLFQPKTTTRERPRGRSTFSVLFYGTFIPLHGVTTIIRAANLCELEDIRWTLIGKGQESPLVQTLLAERRTNNVQQIDWVPYEQLREWIVEADVCLGVFGATAKAQIVIPNKVFQLIAAGKPLITADTPAIRELVEPGPFVHLVPAADPEALARKVMELRDLPPPQADAAYEALRERIRPERIGADFAAVLRRELRG